MPILPNYSKSGGLIPRGDGLQAQVNTIKELLSRVQGIEQNQPFEPQERFIATVQAHGPATDSTGKANAADYTDARYWLKRQLVLGGDEGDAVKLADNQTDVDQGIADAMWVTATNMPEVSNKTHQLPTDGSLTVEVFGFWDVGDPQNRRYLFYAAPPVGFWAVINGYGSTKYHTGGGYYNKPYAYAWYEVTFNVNPGAAQTPPLPPVALSFAKARNGTVNGGTSTTTYTDSGPAYNANELAIMSTSIETPMLPIRVGSTVWMRQEFDSKQPTQKIWVFDDPADSMIPIVIDGNDTGYGQYTGFALNGFGTQATGVNFTQTPYSLGHVRPQGMNLDGPILACNTMEANLVGWRLQTTYTADDGTQTCPVFTGRYIGDTADGKRIVLFDGGAGMGKRDYYSVSTRAWNFYETSSTYAGQGYHIAVQVAGGLTVNMYFDATGRLVNTSPAG